MVYVRTSLVFAASLYSSCASTLDADYEGRACSAEGECLPGFRCNEQRSCVRADGTLPIDDASVHASTIQPPDAGKTSAGDWGAAGSSVWGNAGLESDAGAADARVASEGTKGPVAGPAPPAAAAAPPPMAAAMADAAPPAMAASMADAGSPPMAAAVTDAAVPPATAPPPTPPAMAAPPPAPAPPADAGAVAGTSDKRPDAGPSDAGQKDDDKGSKSGDQGDDDKGGQQKSGSSSNGTAGGSMMCSDGKARCGGACVELARDSSNCGACGTKCFSLFGLGGVCRSGSCSLL